jgi:hypothetical protein
MLGSLVRAECNSTFRANPNALHLARLLVLGAPPSWRLLVLGAPPSWRLFALGAPPSWRLLALGAPPSWRLLALGAPPSWRLLALGAPPSWRLFALGAPPSWRLFALGAPPSWRLLADTRPCLSRLEAGAPRTRSPSCALGSDFLAGKHLPILVLGWGLKFTVRERPHKSRLIRIPPLRVEGQVLEGLHTFKIRQRIRC